MFTGYTSTTTSYIISIPVYNQSNQNLNHLFNRVSNININNNNNNNNNNDNDRTNQLLSITSGSIDNNLNKLHNNNKKYKNKKSHNQNGHNQNGHNQNGHNQNGHNNRRNNITTSDKAIYLQHKSNYGIDTVVFNFNRNVNISRKKIFSIKKYDYNNNKNIVDEIIKFANTNINSWTESKIYSFYIKLSNIFGSNDIYNENTLRNDLNNVMNNFYN